MDASTRVGGDPFSFAPPPPGTKGVNPAEVIPSPPISAPSLITIPMVGAIGTEMGNSDMNAGNKTMIIILIIVFVLLAALATAFFFMWRGRKTPTDTK